MNRMGRGKRKRMAKNFMVQNGVLDPQILALDIFQKSSVLFVCFGSGWIWGFLFVIEKAKTLHMQYIL